jgi:nitroreductase
MAGPTLPWRPPRIPHDDALRRGEALLEELSGRRSVRAFAPDAVPRRLIELAIACAGTAPSGAHQQPWSFVAVSDPAIKARIREAAEEEERRFYGERITEPWRAALEPLGTDWHKPFLEIAPWIVVVFAQRHGVEPDGSARKHYYVAESVGIAVGLFLAAAHRMGLSTLTHTPSPMGFLSDVLDRPPNEKAYVLIPVGYPAEDATVPDLTRKPLTEISTFKTG